MKRNRPHPKSPAKSQAKSQAKSNPKSHPGSPANQHSDNAGSAPRAHRGGPPPTVIYGWHAGRAALANDNRTIRRILVHENARTRLRNENIANCPDTAATPAEIDKAAGPGAVHQGIVVVCDPLPETGIEDLVDPRLLVILDQITDPHNVGAILRSAAVFGADALVMTERNSPVASGVLAKAASGALEHVPLIRVKNLARTLDHFSQADVVLIGLDSSFETSIGDIAGTLPASHPLALILGAENKGLRRLTREKCDHLVHIAASGPITSLNVSNAAAIALHTLSGRA